MTCRPACWRTGSSAEAPEAEIEIVDSLALVSPLIAPTGPGQLALSLQVGEPAVRPLLQADHRRAADALVRGEADPVAGRQADPAGCPRAGARRRGLHLSGHHRGARRPAGQGKDRRPRSSRRSPTWRRCASGRIRGVDLHLITHPESVEEVLQIAPGTEVRCVRGLTDERFYVHREPGRGAARPRPAGRGTGGDRLGRRLGRRGPGGSDRGGPGGPRCDGRLPLRPKRSAPRRADAALRRASRGCASRASRSRCPIGSLQPTCSCTPPRA